MPSSPPTGHTAVPATRAPSRASRITHHASGAARSMRQNETKRRLAAGGHVVGTIIPTNDAALIEVSALAGFDHVIIDGEHGNVSVRDVEELVRAAEAAGVTPLARVPSNTAV